MARRFAIALVLVALAPAACGGGEDDGTTVAEETTAAEETTTAEETTAANGEGETGSCTAVEEVAVEEFGTHKDRDFTAEDYETNPPSGGDHNPTPIEAGKFYPRPPRLGEAVHLLEHGAVIGWTNELARADQKAIEDEFNEVFADGYDQLAVVENPDLEVPFALSAWGFVQTCEEPDTSVIRPFIEQHYAPATSGESSLACQGGARRLPPCRAPR